MTLLSAMVAPLLLDSVIFRGEEEDATGCPFKGVATASSLLALSSLFGLLSSFLLLTVLSTALSDDDAALLLSLVAVVVLAATSVVPEMTNPTPPYLPSILSVSSAAS